MTTIVGSSDVVVLHEHDDVVIAGADLPSGTRVALGGCEITTRGGNRPSRFAGFLLLGLGCEDNQDRAADPGGAPAEGSAGAEEFVPWHLGTIM